MAEPHRSRRSWFGAGLVLALAVFLTSCEKKPEPPALPDSLSLTPVGFDQVPGWADDAVAEALPALRRSCARLVRRDAGTGNGLGGTTADWRGPCDAIAGLAADDTAGLRTLLERDFVPLLAANQNGKPGTFTGYYEPELRGARTPDQTYRWPIYARPDDLISVDLGSFMAELAGNKLVGRVENGVLTPYLTREQIDSGALRDRGHELMWLADPVDVFFLHIQGSGKVVLPDGSVTRVGFAESNGHGYVSVGKVLLQEGRLKRTEASSQGIAAWLRDNPAEANAFMWRNPRYIFFRELTGEGPIGAQGVALTPKRSLAIDPAFIPLGVPIWLDTTWPGDDKPLRRLVVAQDTGAAIKGPVRGDFYWGSGAAALEHAGRMNQKGAFYLLLPKPLAERIAQTS